MSSAARRGGSEILDLVGSSGALSAANTGRLRYDTGTQKFQASVNGGSFTDVVTGSGLAIGSTITSAIAGSVLFAGVAGALAQDNPNLFWDDPNNRLGIGTATPGYQLDLRLATTPLTGIHLRSGAVTDTGGYIISAQDNQIICSGGMGFDGTDWRAKATTASFMAAQLGGVEMGSDSGLTVGNTFTPTGRFFFHPAGGLAILNSDSATVSAASQGKIRYSTSGQVLQTSLNTNAYFNIPQLEAALTSGSVVFANSSGRLAQDNTNLFWNDASNLLQIGRNGAAFFTDTAFEVFRTGGHCVASIVTTTAASDAVLILGTLTTGDAAIFLDESDSMKLKFASGDVSTDAGRNTNTWMTIQTDGRIGIGTAAPTAAYQLHVVRSVAAQGVALIQSTSATGFSTINFVNEAGTFILGVGHDNSSDTSYIDNASSVNPFLISASLTGLVTTNVRNLSTTGYSAVQYLNSSSVAQGSLGFANASVAVTHLQSRLYWFSGSSDIVFANITRNEHTFGMTSGSAFHELANGSSAAVSAASAGRLRYNTTGQLFQISKNAVAYEDVASLATAQTFTKSQNVLAVALTDAANISTDASLGNIFTVTLAGNRTLDNPTNLVSGGVYRWVVTQDATGARTLAYGTLFKWPGGVAPVLTLTANAIDTIEAVYNGTVLLATFALNLS